MAYREHVMGFVCITANECFLHSKAPPSGVKKNKTDYWLEFVTLLRKLNNKLM